MQKTCLNWSNPHSPYKPSPRDFRWRHRYEAWNIATHCKLLYDGGNIGRHDILKLARKIGFWSVWFTVFRGYDKFRLHLIEGSPGTCKSCFAPSNHYEPVPRNHREQSTLGAGHPIGAGRNKEEISKGG